MDGYIALIVPLIFQLVGAIIVFASQASFYLKVKRKYGNLVKAFYKISAPRWTMTDEELEKASPEDILKESPLTELLYKNYRNSFVGASLTLLGVIMSVVRF